MQGRPIHKHAFRVRDLGRGVSYAEGTGIMRAEGERVDDEGPVLLLLEHAPTITVTRAGGRTHVLADDDALACAGIELVETDRGGDVTFHGPGQLVGYPVLKLPFERRHLDLEGYIRALEAGLVDAVTALGVAGAHVKPGMTGVWIASDASAPTTTWVDDDGARKLVAIGVGVGRGGVTRHGFALNLDIDLAPYLDAIVPCGLKGRGVTTLRAELGEHCPDGATVREVVSRCVRERLEAFANQDFTHKHLQSSPVGDQSPAAEASADHDGALHG